MGGAAGIGTNHGVAEGLPETSITHDAVASRDDLRALLGSVVARLEWASGTAGAQQQSLVQQALDAARQAVVLADIETPATNEVIPPRAQREAVLVVDDNAGVRRVVVRQLHELGYRALEAEDGPAALMTLNTQAVDILFTDVVMPGGMSGFDLARLVLSRWPDMKALITSGFPELEPEGDSASQAKLRRLIKPYRKADLERALREVLDG